MIFIMMMLILCQDLNLRIEHMLEERLGNWFLGDRLTVDVVDVETQMPLVLANRRISRTDIRRIVRRRDFVSTNATHVMERFVSAFNEFRPYFDTLANDVMEIRRVRIFLRRQDS